MSKSHRDENGQLTREGMIHVINNGGSVMHKNRIISRVEDLPDIAELAEGNAEQEKAALDVLDRQQKLIDDQRARLTRSKTKAPQTDTTTGGADPVAALLKKSAKK